jgi:co-chaperonin GroES (HSP10)
MTAWVRSLGAGCSFLVAASAAVAQQTFITVASTTSTEESGLFGYLLPAFAKETNIEVRVVAVGTGQALKIGERGDCDVVFVHDTLAELAFVERGFGIDRREVMYNDFILVGPATDPAHAGGGKDIVAAFRKMRMPKRHSSHVATTAAPIRRRCACGTKPGSTRRRRAEVVIGTRAPGWGRLSMRRPKWMVIRFPIVEHGSASRTSRT